MQNGGGGKREREREKGRERSRRGGDEERKKRGTSKPAQPPAPLPAAAALRAQGTRLFPPRTPLSLTRRVKPLLPGAQERLGRRPRCPAAPAHAAGLPRGGAAARAAPAGGAGAVPSEAAAAKGAAPQSQASARSGGSRPPAAPAPGAQGRALARAAQPLPPPAAAPVALRRPALVKTRRGAGGGGAAEGDGTAQGGVGGGIVGRWWRAEEAVNELWGRGCRLCPCRRRPRAAGRFAVTGSVALGSLPHTPGRPFLARRHRLPLVSGHLWGSEGAGSCGTVLPLWGGRGDRQPVPWCCGVARVALPHAALL